VLVACLAVVGQFDSAELREEIEQAPNPFGVVVDPDDVLRAMRVMLTGVAVLSITAVVFAVYAFRGHRPSRIGLAVLVPVMLVPSAVSGWAGLIPALLAVVGVVLLWSPASRDWFAAVGGGAAPARAVSTQRGDAMSNPTPPPGQEPQDPSGPPPPPQYGSGYGESQPPPPPPAYEPPPASDPQQGPAYPQGHPPYGSSGYDQPSPYPRKRPGIVTAAAVITMVMTVLTGLGWLLLGIFMVAGGDTIIDEVRDDPDLRADLDDGGITLSQLQDGITVFGVIALVIGVLMLLVVWPAIGVLRGSGAARIIVAVLAGICTLVGLFFTVFGGGTGIPWALTGLLVVILLFVGDAGSWFAGKKAGAV